MRPEALRGSYLQDRLFTSGLFVACVCGGRMAIRPTFSLAYAPDDKWLWTAAITRSYVTR